MHGYTEGALDNQRDDGEEPVREFWLVVAITCIDFIEMIDQGRMRDVYDELSLEEELWQDEAWTAGEMRGSLKIIATTAIEHM